MKEEDTQELSSTYAFRIRFFVHMAGVFESLDSDVTYAFRGTFQMRLSSIEGKPISESKEFVLFSSGFISERDAWDVGFKVKAALLLAGVSLRIGIDAGNDKSSSSCSEMIRENYFRTNGAKLLNNVHGLSVFENSFPVKFLSISATGLTNRLVPEAFVQAIEKQFLNLPPISSKESLAIELFGAAHFEKSDRARFITLILALEGLLEPKKRAPDVQSHVEQLITLTKSSLISMDEKSSILGSLEWLFSESISQGIKRMTSTYLGDRSYGGFTAKKFITHCYEVRSKLVHTGSISESVHIGGLSSQLSLFISDLLKEKIGIRIN